MKNKCENLSLYIAGEMSEEEEKQFEEHLEKCPGCRQEIDSMQEAWHMLSYDMEEVEVPESLKSEVMDFVFAEEDEESRTTETPPSETERLKQFFEKQFSPLTAVLTGVLLIGLIGLFWNNMELKEAVSSYEEQTLSPVQIVHTFQLTGQNTAASANGVAYLLRKGNEQSLVIELNNMPETTNNEVYQVWLLKDGSRQNAGTLQPTDKGNGLITYQLPKDQSFDDIGITLEPRPDNTQPEGEKVMGTS